MSHADHSQPKLLVVAAFAVYSFARICLHVSKLPAANSAHLCMAHFNAQNLNLLHISILYRCHVERFLKHADKVLCIWITDGIGDVFHGHVTVF